MAKEIAQKIYAFMTNHFNLYGLIYEYFIVRDWYIIGGIASQA